MLLLEYCSAGAGTDDVILKNFPGDKVPPYAILSHTWGADVEEVTLKDLKDGTGKDKAGWQKLQFCGQQAQRDGLKYFWVGCLCFMSAVSRNDCPALLSLSSGPIWSPSEYQTFTGPNVC